MIESFQMTLDNQETRQLIYRLSEPNLPDGWYVQHDNVQYRVERETFDMKVASVDDPDRLRSLPRRIESMNDVHRFSIPQVNADGVVVPSIENKEIVSKNLVRLLGKEIETMFLPEGGV